MQNPYCYLSDDCRTVVVFEGEREEQYTVDEFVEIYGEESLPSSDSFRSKVVITDEILEEMCRAEEDACNNYYEIMNEFLNSIGYYLGFKKLVENYDDAPDKERSKSGAIIVEKYGVPIRNIDQELQNKREHCWHLFRELNNAAEALGISPIGESAIGDLEDTSRRDSVRRSAKRACLSHELVSLEQLLQRRLLRENSASERGKLDE